MRTIKLTLAETHLGLEVYTDEVLYVNPDSIKMISPEDPGTMTYLRVFLKDETYPLYCRETYEEVFSVKQGKAARFV